jgi:uncharacterized membrane protein
MSDTSTIDCIDTIRNLKEALVMVKERPLISSLAIGLILNLPHNLRALSHRLIPAADLLSYPFIAFLEGYIIYGLIHMLLGIVDRQPINFWTLFQKKPPLRALLWITIVGLLTCHEVGRVLLLAAWLARGAELFICPVLMVDQGVLPKAAWRKSSKMAQGFRFGIFRMQVLLGLLCYISFVIAAESFQSLLRVHPRGITGLIASLISLATVGFGFWSVLSIVSITLVITFRQLTKTSEMINGGGYGQQGGPTTDEKTM